VRVVLLLLLLLLLLQLLLSVRMSRVWVVGVVLSLGVSMTGVRPCCRHPLDRERVLFWQSRAKKRGCPSTRVSSLPKRQPAKQTAVTGGQGRAQRVSFKEASLSPPFHLHLRPTTPLRSPSQHNTITTMDFEARLASIGQVANQKDKIKGYQDLLAAILQETATDEATTRQRLEQFITAATEDSAGLVVSRQVLTDFTNAVDGASNISAENKKEIYKHALDKVHGRVVSFEEQVMRPKKGAPVRLTSSLVARCNIGTFTPRKLWLNHSVSSVISP